MLGCKRVRLFSDGMGGGGVTVAKKRSQTSAIDSLYETNHEAEIPQHDVLISTFLKKFS